MTQATRSAGRMAAAWTVVADAAGVTHGASVLDLGCGTGGFCAFAAARGARAHGVDADAEALAVAVRRVPDADFRLGLLEGLPLPDDAVEVVTAFNALQYALDVDAALREARRVTRPGGRLAVCKWGPPAGNAFFTFLGSLGAGRVADDILDPVEAALARTRLALETSGDVPAVLEFADGPALGDALRRAGAPADADTVAAAAAPFRTDNGGYRFENRLRCWVLRV